MKTLSLRQNWLLLEQPLSVGVNQAEAVLAVRDGWMEVPSVPCDVHTVLQAHGRIEDPLIGNNSFACAWIEERSFWFKKTFIWDGADEAELVLEMLDIHADLFLNGEYLGHHASAMREFRLEVTNFLRRDENVLLIRLTTGLERVKEEELAPVRDYVACEWRSRRKGRGDERRVMLRKPQYVFGWDQSPRLATCAIGGDAYLEILSPVAVRDIHFETLALTDAGARLLVEAEVESRERLFARELAVTFTLEREGVSVHRETKNILAQCGHNYLDFSFTLSDPALWWPNGYGEQNLYTVRVEAVGTEGARDEKTIRAGIRTVELDTAPINEEERRYRFLINGKPIYCRGADFIMTNQLYAAVSPELQRRLLAAARDAHFCMLRFWDGNLYQSDAVYDACDEFGILVLQNFCFACGAYPDHLAWFREEAKREAIYQIKRLRNHPSLALWIGNGECNTVLNHFLGRRFFEENDPARYPGGTYLYNTLLPRVHRALSASVGYQCTTPFGYFGGNACSPLRGTRHYYPFLDTRPENLQYRISADSVDALECKFIMESGIMGPPSAESLIQSCGGRENTAPESPVFLHHYSTFEQGAVRAAVARHYTGDREITLEEYCLYGGLFQGELLGYEADHVRSRPNCGGSLFWCFNDGFGEVGFSMMEHSGAPKPVYFFLKRAYAPRRLILKKNGGTVTVFCTNSSQESFCGTLLYGRTAPDGSRREERELPFSLPAFAPATPVAEIALPADPAGELLYARCAGLDTALYRAVDFRQRKIPRKAKLTLAPVSASPEALVFTVSSDIYAHAVHFTAGDPLSFSDLYFDLLPGESKTVTLREPGRLTLTDLAPDCVFPE